MTSHPKAISIRPAEHADLPRLVEIYNHYVLHTSITFDIDAYTVDARGPWFEQFGSSGRHRLLVAVAAGSVVGYAGTTQFRVKAAYDTTVETTVYVAPDAQRLGAGSALYTALFDVLRDEDIRSYIAGITLPNEPSVAMHERFGFRPCGTMHAVGRKFDRYWDVGWYERC